VSYPFYKVLHVASIFVFLISLGAIFRSDEKSKLHNILLGISSLIILVGGMGLIKHMGIPHGGKWPMWLHAKLGVWITLAVGAPIVAKKVRSKRGLALSVFGFLAICAVYFAVNKPA